MRWATNLGFYRILGSWLCRISSDSLAQSVSGTANSVTAAILDALARTPFSETFIFWINRWGVFKQVTKLAETAAPEIKASAAELQVACNTCKPDYRYVHHTAYNDIYGDQGFRKHALMNCNE